MNVFYTVKSRKEEEQMLASRPHESRTEAVSAAKSIGAARGARTTVPATHGVVCVSHCLHSEKAPLTTWICCKCRTTVKSDYVPRSVSAFEPEGL